MLCVRRVLGHDRASLRFVGHGQAGSSARREPLCLRPLRQTRTCPSWEEGEGITLTSVLSRPGRGRGAPITSTGSSSPLGKPLHDSMSRATKGIDAIQAGPHPPGFPPARERQLIKGFLGGQGENGISWCLSLRSRCLWRRRGRSGSPRPGPLSRRCRRPAPWPRTSRYGRGCSQTSCT